MTNSMTNSMTKTKPVNVININKAVYEHGKSKFKQEMDSDVEPNEEHIKQQEMKELQEYLKSNDESTE